MDYKEKVIALLNSQELSKEQKESLEAIFPELAESEDERIRKELIDYCKSKAEKYPNDPKYLNIGRWIAWLEKQNKQNSKNTNKECLKGIKRVQEYQDLSDWEKKFDNIASMYAHNKNQEGYNESWYVKERAAAMLYHAKKELEKQGEQKPAWSEKDEHHKRQILRIFKDNGCSQTLQDKTEKWIEERLKSLKPNHWKPSLAQLNALGVVAKGNAPDDIEEISSLYKDLKNLKD